MPVGQEKGIKNRLVKSAQFPIRRRALRAHLFMAFFLVTAAQAGAQQHQCWSEDQKKFSPGENKVRKWTKSAYVPPPKGQPSKPSRELPLRWGSIRRVNFPQGSPKRIALTFDLCEQPNEISGYQGRIVDTLRKHNVKATFYAGGKWMLTHERRAGQLMADPLFELQNHSWEHRNMRTITNDEAVKAIKYTQRAYEIIRTNLADKQCLNQNRQDKGHPAPAPQMTQFRFPFGACRKTHFDMARAQGLLTVQWDVSSADPDRNMGPRQMARTVLRRVKNGSIVLFHANGRGWHTDQALPVIVKNLKKRGYEFLTVSELLAQKNGEWVVKDKCYDTVPGDTNRYDRFARHLNKTYDRFNRWVHGKGPKPLRTRKRKSRPKKKSEPFPSPWGW